MIRANSVWKSSICLCSNMTYLAKIFLGKDAVDHKRNCIRLTLERHGEDDEQREMGNVYALCTLDSMRIPVHVVQSNPLM